MIDRLLSSLAAQSRRPDQIIIVDGGDAALDGVVARYASLPIMHIKAETSLTEARNLGMKSLGPDIRYVAYLDDDIVFQEGALEAMEAFWSSAAPDVGGAGFNITNEATKRWGNVLKWPFLLDHKKSGAVLRSGFHSSYCPAATTHEVQWLYGGATSWRRAVLEQFKFDEWYEGYGYMEDVDFSYRVSGAYRLVVVAPAHIQHLHAPGDRVNDVRFGKMQIINRYNLVRKDPRLSTPLFIWGACGQIIENAARWIVQRRQSFLMKSWGNFVGLLGVLFLGHRRLTPQKFIKKHQNKGTI